MRTTLWALLVLVIIAAAGGGWYWHTHQTAASAKMYHIGILVRGSGYEPAVDGYKKRMTEFGYIEGKNISYDVRYVSTATDTTKAIQDFIANNDDVIHTYSTPATTAAYEATKNMPHPIPIVFGSVGDPLLIDGAVKDMQTPGSNVTGVASLSVELTAQRVQILHELDPKITRVAMPHTAESLNDAAANHSVTIAQTTAQPLGMTLTLYPVSVAADNATVAAKITNKNADAIIVGGDSLVWAGMSGYIKQAIAQKIPLSVFSLDQVQQGALMGVGPDFSVSGAEAADITIKILNGHSPASIPIQTPQKLIFAINLDTAKKIGVTFPDEMLKRADVVIPAK